MVSTREIGGTYSYDSCKRSWYAKTSSCRTSTKSGARCWGAFYAAMYMFWQSSGPARKMVKMHARAIGPYLQVSSDAKVVCMRERVCSGVRMRLLCEAALLVLVED